MILKIIYNIQMLSQITNTLCKVVAKLGHMHLNKKEGDGAILKTVKI